MKVFLSTNHLDNILISGEGIKVIIRRNKNYKYDCLCGSVFDDAYRLVKHAEQQHGLDCLVNPFEESDPTADDPIRPDTPTNWEKSSNSSEDIVQSQLLDVDINDAANDMVVDPEANNDADIDDNKSDVTLDYIDPPEDMPKASEHSYHTQRPQEEQSDDIDMEGYTTSALLRDYSLQKRESHLLRDHEFLKAVDCFYHVDHHVLICHSCEKAITPKDLFGHMHDTHALTFPKENFRDAFNDFMEEYFVPADTKVPTPAPMGPPVEGLKIIEGLLCSMEGCGFACANVKHMKNHMAKKHHTSAATHQPLDCSMQTFFHPVGTKYFAVNANTLMIADQPDIVFNLFLSHAQQTLANIVPAPIRSKEDLPLLIHFTGWEDRVADIRNSKVECRQLLELMDLPKYPEDGYLGYIPGVVKQYYQEGITQVKSTWQMVRRMLYQYPMYDSSTLSSALILT
ncbi:hypothetical protein K474DRAFT_1713899 [Panus rudis PR-1116 ss-1]|nr:hypothetical protein K474DRAFT_1713899 [Panus rudis PR-1116 ss-1]